MQPLIRTILNLMLYFIFLSRSASRVPLFPRKCFSVQSEQTVAFIRHHLGSLRRLRHHPVGVDHRTTAPVSIIRTNTTIYSSPYNLDRVLLASCACSTSNLILDALFSFAQLQSFPRCAFLFMVRKVVTTPKPSPSMIARKGRLAAPFAVVRFL